MASGSLPCRVRAGLGGCLLRSETTTGWQVGSTDIRPKIASCTRAQRIADNESKSNSLSRPYSSAAIVAQKRLSIFRHALGPTPLTRTSPLTETWQHQISEKKRYHLQSETRLHRESATTKRTFPRLFALIAAGCRSSGPKEGRPQLRPLLSSSVIASFARWSSKGVHVGLGD